VGQYQETVLFLEKMKMLQISKDRAYEILGLAWGRGVLTTNQTGEAFRDYRRSWKNQEHPFHPFANTAYGLYQNFTHALKLGKDISRKIDKYTGASRLFEEVVIN
jgi:hypothetical protein